jgi:uncharacterized protein (TIGR02147 family)
MPKFVYEAQSYREVLLAKISSNRARRGYKTELARAAGCHRSHLSQVIGARSDLTEEQALGLARFWEYGEPETERFLYMLKSSRAASKELRDFYAKRVNALGRDVAQVSLGYSDAAVLGADEQAIYYSSWHYAATHILLAIPGFASAEAVANRLRIPAPVAQSAIRTLEKLKLIRKKGGAWQLTNRSTYLPREAPLTRMSHLNWRQQATQKIQHHDGNAMNITSVFALSRNDFERFKHRVVALAESMHQEVENSPEEELVAFCCDLFQV